MPRSSILFAMLCAISVSACGEAKPQISEQLSFLGKSRGYTSELKLAFLAPEKETWPSDYYREARLLEDFEYIDAAGRSWKVPAGYVTDGASIPARVWSAGIGPYDGPYRDAAVLHDYYCEKKGLGRSWQDVLDMFRDAALERGTSDATVKLLYGGVYLGSFLGFCTWSDEEAAEMARGTAVPPLVTPRSWMTTVERMLVVDVAKPTLSMQEQQALKELQDWIQRENPSYEEIRKRAEEINKRLKNVRPQT